MAAGGGDLRCPAKRSWPDRPLWRHRQKEMGDQFGLHGDVRVRVGFGRLGPIRLQHGLWAGMVVDRWTKFSRHTWFSDISGIHAWPNYHTGSRFGHAATGVPDGDADVLPIRVRRDHRHHPWRFAARPHELHGLDDLLPGMDDAGLYRGRVQPLGWRLARCDGCG